MTSSLCVLQVKTHGLVGCWNGDPADDLTPRDWLEGSVPDDQPQQIHHDFGLSCNFPLRFLAKPMFLVCFCANFSITPVDRPAVHVTKNLEVFQARRFDARQL